MGKEIFETHRGGRLTGEMDPLVNKYFYGPERGFMGRGWQMHHKAHVVMLTEEGLIPKEAGIKILKALRQMDKEGVQKVKEEIGGHSRGALIAELYVAKVAGPDVAGWMNLGRAGAEPKFVGLRISVRDDIIAILKELINIRRTFLDKAGEHIETVMPGYTHLQIGEPTTLGHYLLSWVHPFERDSENFQAAYKHTNISPAGCGIGTTTDFPVNRERAQALLGFDGMYTNAKDAVWSQDYLLQFLFAMVATAGDLSRLAEDLHIWKSNEFGMVEHPMAYCGTSALMPQKRNAYGTETVRGLYANITGPLMSFLLVTKAHSDAVEKTGLGVEPIVSETPQKCLGALQIINGIVRDLEVNRELMKERAGMFWAQASFLANKIVKDKKIPFRLAHQSVGRLVKNAYDEGKAVQDITSEMLDRATKEVIGKPLYLGEEALREALDPAIIVKSKKIVGGTAPERIREDIARSLERVKEDEKIVSAMESKLAAAERGLEEAIDKITGEA